jgi:hypothetical protein
LRTIILNTLERVFLTTSYEVRIDPAAIMHARSMQQQHHAAYSMQQETWFMIMNHGCCCLLHGALVPRAAARGYAYTIMTWPRRR